MTRVKFISIRDHYQVRFHTRHVKFISIRDHYQVRFHITRVRFISVRDHYQNHFHMRLVKFISLHDHYQVRFHIRQAKFISVRVHFQVYVNRNVSKCIFEHMRPAKIQISLRIPHSLISILSGGIPVSILHKSIAGCHRPVSYPDGPITARYRFM